MNKRHYEHTLPNIRGSLSNTYLQLSLGLFLFFESHSFFSVRIPGQDAVRSQIYTKKRKNRQVGLFFVLS